MVWSSEDCLRYTFCEIVAIFSRASTLTSLGVLGERVWGGFWVLGVWDLRFRFGVLVCAWRCMGSCIFCSLNDRFMLVKDRVVYSAVGVWRGVLHMISVLGKCERSWIEPAAHTCIIAAFGTRSGQGVFYHTQVTLGVFYHTQVTFFYRFPSYPCRPR